MSKPRYIAFLFLASLVWSISGLVPSVYAANHEISKKQVTGRWSFDATCASGNGMVLLENGTGGVTETLFGTWRLKRRTIVFNVKNAETEKNETLRARIISISPTQIRVQFDPSDPILTGKFCSKN